MKFCPKDGAVMQIKKVNGKTAWVCPVCGYTEQIRETSQTTQRLSIKRKERMIEIDPNQQANLPKIKITCPKCGKEVEAYYWMEQTRAGDEPMTRFYKCTVCGYVWREYA